MPVIPVESFPELSFQDTYLRKTHSKKKPLGILRAPSFCSGSCWQKFCGEK